jgi:hypothetical protein
MRSPGPIHVLLSLLLAAWLPWCLCNRVDAGCCDRSGTEPIAAPSCGESCCPSDAVPPDDGAPHRKGCRPFGECPAGCCVTKGPVTGSMPEIPVDLVGSPIPPTLAADRARHREADPHAVRPAHPPARGFDRSRPADRRALSARGLLATICLHTT